MKFGKQIDANSKFSGGTSSTDLKSSQVVQPKKAMKVSLDAWHDKSSNDTKTSKKATIENITIENLSDTEKRPPRLHCGSVCQSGLQWPQDIHQAEAS